nr:hypothetical protein [Desulfuromonadales bacterium]
MTLVLEIENSAFETCYSSIVETENAKFNRLAGEIDRETNEHRQYLGELLDAEQSGEDCRITKSAQNS